MKLSNKILTEEDVKDILYESDFEHIKDNVFQSCNYEEEVEVKLVGNKLRHLISWIYRYYEKKAGESGENRGKGKLRQDIKGLLEIN